MVKVIRLLAVGAGAFVMVFFVKKIFLKKGAKEEALIDRIRACGT